MNRDTTRPDWVEPFLAANAGYAQRFALGGLEARAERGVAVVTCMGTLGINTTSLAAIVGAAGLAIGLALQGNLGNLAAGVLLLIFRPFKIGDAVIVAGQAGVVDGIDLFTQP